MDKVTYRWWVFRSQALEEERDVYKEIAEWYYYKCQGDGCLGCIPCNQYETAKSNTGV